MERGAERDGEQELDYPRVLRDLRTSLRLTQAALAERLGVTCVTVNGWENGKHVPMPALAGAVTRLARRAGVLPGPGEEKTDGVVPRPPNGKRLAAGKRAATSDRNSPDPGEVAPVPAGELSGWPPTERERRDLYHRVREFPDAVAGWRRRLAEHVMRSPDLFPAVSSGATPEDIRSRLDDGIS
ncbi:MAG: helix-turn-helix transcriptional regulator, partial [Verrucomicrobia bacterium]|nr:helix-turn-helix transcriptional regulator [Verrucomicrobiota bacterium]